METVDVSQTAEAVKIVPSEDEVTFLPSRPHFFTLLHQKPFFDDGWVTPNVDAVGSA